MSDALFEKETLVYNDIVQILGERPYGMNKNYESFVKATSMMAEAGVEGLDEDGMLNDEQGKEMKDKSNESTDGTGGTSSGSSTESISMENDSEAVPTVKLSGTESTKGTETSVSSTSASSQSLKFKTCIMPTVVAISTAEEMLLAANERANNMIPEIEKLGDS